MRVGREVQEVLRPENERQLTSGLARRWRGRGTFFRCCDQHLPAAHRRLLPSDRFAAPLLAATAGAATHQEVAFDMSRPRRCVRPSGRSGRPSAGQCCIAATSASCARLQGA
jgi:hypothetical protein